MNPTNEEMISSVDFSTAKINRLSTHAGLKTILYLFTICFILKFAALPLVHAQALGADNNRRYDQNAYLEAHDAYATPSAHYFCWYFCNQDRSIGDQLDAGVRSLDLRIWKVRQFKYAANYQARIYNSDGDHKDTFSSSLLIGDSYGDHDPQVVLGHHIYDTGLGYLEGGLGGFTGALYPLEKFSDRLEKIRKWLEDHPNEVVTLNVKSSVPKDNADLTRQAFADADLSPKQMFILGNDYVNLDLPPTHGRPGGLRPQPDGWWFPMDGMPTLQYLINHQRRLVYSDGRTWNSNSSDNVIVSTIYGNHSVPTTCSGDHYDDWENKDKDNENAIDDFRVPLFMMQHVRDDPEPTHEFTKCVQDIKWLKDRLFYIEAQWHRLPNLVRVDHAAKTSEINFGGSTFDGPKAFVSYLNQRWAEQPTITPTYALSPNPNSFGWNNTTVSVTGMWGNTADPTRTDPIREVIYSIFDAPTGGSTMPGILVDKAVSKIPASVVYFSEGKSVLSFYAIGSQGNASDRGYVDIWIDTTLPTISGHVDRAPNTYGWYQSDVTGSFTYQDATPTSKPGIAFSGIDPNPLNTTPTVVLSTEGSDQTITGKATDKAGNVGTASLTGIKLDKTKPTITYTGNSGKYTPDQFINITCTPADNLSGVRVHTCQNISGEGYDFVDGSQKITPHAYSAETTDYADNVGNGSTSFTVEVNQQAVSNLTARFVSNAGVANSLQQKLRSATEAQNRGDLEGKEHHVDVYIKELQNHINRFVSSKNAATLIRLARAF
jgi:hypothetical protein